MSFLKTAALGLLGLVCGAVIALCYVGLYAVALVINYLGV